MNEPTQERRVIGLDAHPYLFSGPIRTVDRGLAARRRPIALTRIACPLYAPFYAPLTRD